MSQLTVGTKRGQLPCSSVAQEQQHVWSNYWQSKSEHNGASRLKHQSPACQKITKLLFHILSDGSCFHSRQCASIITQPVNAFLWLTVCSLPVIYECCSYQILFRVSIIYSGHHMLHVKHQSRAGTLETPQVCQTERGTLSNKMGPWCIASLLKISHYAFDYIPLCWENHQRVLVEMQSSVAFMF